MLKAVDLGGSSVASSRVFMGFSGSISHLGVEVIWVASWVRDLADSRLTDQSFARIVLFVVKISVSLRDCVHDTV